MQSDKFLAILAKCFTTIYLTLSIWWKKNAEMWIVTGVEDGSQSCSREGSGQEKHLCLGSILCVAINSSRCFRLAQLCQKAFLTLCSLVRMLGFLSPRCMPQLPLGSASWCLRVLPYRSKANWVPIGCAAPVLKKKEQPKAFYSSQFYEKSLEGHVQSHLGSCGADADGALPITWIFSLASSWLNSRF